MVEVDSVPKKRLLLKRSELKLIRKLGLNPSLNQSDVAKEFGISRCAVNQTWKSLEKNKSLRIHSYIDYGLYGVGHVFGWSKSKLGTKTLQKFRNWLQSSDYTSAIKTSQISSDMESAVYFEALFIGTKQASWFLRQVERFQKNPYNLTIELSDVTSQASHMNFGLFEKNRWNFEDDFQIQASIGAVGKYVDILPESRMLHYSDDGGDKSLEDLIIAATLEQNYHSSARDIAKQLKRVNLPTPSLRTLRRRLVEARSDGILPYMEIKNIALDQELFICVKGSGSTSKLLQAQLISFPSCSIISGENMTVFKVKFPNETDWFKISQMILGQATDEIFTFIASKKAVLKGAESIVNYLQKKSIS
jgi:DNA-binding Lrp family transcriptional regulator